MRQAKRWIIILGVAGVLGLSGCGGSNDMEKSEQEYSLAADVTSGYAEEYEDDAAETSDSGASGADIAEQQAGKKLIVTQELNVETSEFGTFMDTVNRRAEALGGYIERSEISGSAEYRNQSANFCIRIPAEKLAEFIVSVEENGTVVYNSKSTEDVTLQYVDTESHLKALKVEEKTLLSLLEKAEKLSDIFAIQEELTEVRYQIDSYESQLRVYDNQVDYSTVNLSVTEVFRETTAVKNGFWSEASAGFSDSLYSVGRAFRGFGVWFISCIPQLFTCGAVIVVLWLIVRRFLKKRGKKNVNHN